MNRLLVFVALVGATIAVAAARSLLRMPPPEPRRPDSRTSMPRVVPDPPRAGWCPAPPAEYDMPGRWMR